MKKIFILVMSLLLLSGLAACSILPPAEPVTYYRLPVTRLVLPAPLPSSPPLPISLRINQPHADGLLAGERIVVLPDDNQLSVYQGARWEAPAPVLWRNNIMDSWSQAGKVQYLSTDNEALQVDLELGGTLRAFHTEYHAGQPSVHIQFDAQLIDPRSRRILASQRFSTQQTPASADVAAVVTAFGEAQQQLSQQLLTWLLSVKTAQGR